MQAPIKPSKAEAGNGWEPKKLQAYLEDRNKAASLRIFGNPSEKKRRPMIVQSCKRFNAQTKRWGA